MIFHKLIPYPSQDRDGRLPRLERDIVGALALTHRDVGLHAIEIGTFYGETTATIARAMPRHIVITVDIPENVTPAFDIGPVNRKHVGRTPIFEEDVKPRIERIMCDSALLELPKTAEIGFAFIDGAHTYDYAKNDFNKVNPFVVPGGCVVFHDVGIFEGVAEAVDEIIKTHQWLWSALEGTSLVWGIKR